MVEGCAGVVQDQKTGLVVIIHDILEDVKYLVAVWVIERAVRFVKKQDIRILDKRSRQYTELFLTFA